MVKETCFMFSVVPSIIIEIKKHAVPLKATIFLMEQPVLDTNAGKQLS